MSEEENQTNSWSAKPVFAYNSASRQPEPQQNDAQLGQALQLLNETLISVIYCKYPAKRQNGMKGAEKLSRNNHEPPRRELISFATRNARA